jgi:hypothetical protein
MLPAGMFAAAALPDAVVAVEPAAVVPDAFAVVADELDDLLSDPHAAATTATDMRPATTVSLFPCPILSPC